MKLTSRLLSVALAVALPMGLAQAADYTMRVSHQFPPSHPSAQRMEQFAKDVAQETSNKVEVQLFGAAQLYRPAQHHAAVAGGEIESALILSIQWGGSLPEIAVTQIPYLMSAPAQQKAFLGSKAAQLLDQKMLEKGVRNISWMVDTNDLMFTSSTQLLDEPSKFEGVKMRGLNRLFDAGLIAMGAVPVAMAGSEVYQALQTKVVDAAVTATKAAYSRKYYEVQQFGAASPIVLVYDNLVVNPAWWDGLPEDVRGGITRAADKAAQESIITDENINPEELAQLNQAGMQAVALSPQQIAAFKSAMQPAVLESFLNSTRGKGQELIDLIKAM
ncbi:TRAP transporter substrate-binding protein DctP [Castellaniella sp.]|uniref:TRAP transporter substrate-binding protein DctP n=1 Tax=Castellaniella sp. TaxID=1955812 RepID=UPI002AFDFAC4|nr:TRAP transporter substrate-binding protein DctP [Castellaniella sp.]